MGPRLSVIIITHNESARLRECLQSVAFADEWVVVDSSSTDDTAAIARGFGARVIVTPDWPGFGAQKNRALDAATGEWVLSIDADERVTPALAEAIRSAIAQPAHAGFRLDRRSSYCGQYMAHSGWYPDRILRLFRRDSGRFTDDLVHERLQVQGSVGDLQGELLHDSFADFEAVLDKVNRYSSAGAQALAARGVRGSLGKAVGHGLWAFVRTFVLRRGFLDGRLGFALAVSNGQGAYYRYLKLWLMQKAR